MQAGRIDQLSALKHPVHVRKLIALPSRNVIDSSNVNTSPGSA